MIDTNCPVPFCRDCCPLLPADAEVFRASAGVLCECGAAYREHSKYHYPSGMGHAHRLCNGTFVHL